MSTAKVLIDGDWESVSGEGDPVTEAELAAAVAALSSVYQPLDSDLSAIAALTTTVFGRALLALADAAAGRTALGLGTAATSSSGDFQPVDSDLTALAALSTTAYGRSLLEAANAGAARTLLGLGTAATAATGDFDPAGSAAAAQAASQPVDGDLTAIAALTTTAYGRAFLALADAAAGRTALGLGTAATAATGDFQPADADLTSLAALTTTAYGRSLLETANAAALRTLAGTVIGTDVQAFSAVLAATTASFLTADETKLDGIATGATANDTDANLKNRANHTGTQLAATVSDFDTAARTAAVAQTITNGVTTSAPSQDAVFDALALKAVDADVVHDTGTETIAGVKTFSSDPLIPDEAYDATAWNGVLEPPTKNAVRDALESIIDGQVFTGPITAPAVGTVAGGNFTKVNFRGVLNHSGPPVAGDGACVAGDSCFDNAGQEYLCTADGTPGTWVAVGSGRVIGGPATLTTTFTSATAGTEEDLGLSTSFTYDGRPVNIILDGGGNVSHDQTSTFKANVVAIKRSSDSATQYSKGQPSTCGGSAYTNGSPFQHMETGPITAWPSDAAALVVGTSYTVKATTLPLASTKMRIAAGATVPVRLYVITC